MQTLKTRDEAPQSCYDDIGCIDRKGKEIVKRVHSDKAKKLLSMRKVLRKMGIKPTSTSAHTLGSVWVAQLVYGTILDKARTMMKEAKMPQQYCEKTVDYAAYLYNRRSSLVLYIMSPFKSFFGKITTLNKLKGLGCKVYAHIQNANRKSKLYDHAETGMNMGMDGG